MIALKICDGGVYIFYSLTWVGQALLARLVPGIKEAWNYEPWFNYVDRWITPDHPTDIAAIKADGVKYPYDDKNSQGSSAARLNNSRFHSSVRLFNNDPNGKSAFFIDDMCNRYRSSVP